MSGIHGILRFDGAAVSERDLARQANALSHRGLDRRAQWRDGPVGLGHLLLRVTREDSSDAQPVRDGATVLVADLRLDNREELAALLSLDADTLAGLPDSAVLARAYARWGEACVEHLIGDFAFALWDGARRKLVLARDHIGQRHVHYHIGKDFFAFASEPKGLSVLPGVPHALCLPVLARRLAMDRALLDGVTVFEGILGLQGGTIMSVSADGEIASRRYWEPHADPMHMGRDEAYYIDAYRSVLAEAVACRVRRLRQPPALLLGGGFDSGAIAGLSGAALGAGGKLVCVASVGEDPARGVRKWAAILARHMPHLDMRYITRDGLDVLVDMERNFYAAGEPYSPNRYASQALTAAAAAAGSRVIMDGHGGDYTLNPKGIGWLARRLLRGEFARFASEFRAYRRHSGASFGAALRSEVAAQLLPQPLVRLWRRRTAGLPLSGPAAPITPALIAAAGAVIDESAPNRSGEPAPQMAQVLRRQQSGAVIGGALLAAEHGLVFTQPYHDKRVVELALAIPETLHVRDGRDRHLARIALADILPPQFQTRGRANDELVPDFPQMAQRIAPRLLDEIARLETDKKLAALFDFPRMRAMAGAPGRETAMRQAVRAFLAARYIAWFERGNTPQ